MQDCSQNTSEIALEITAEIANDWNFPSLQVVACARNSGLQTKIKMTFDDFLFMLEVAPQYSLHPISPKAGSSVRLHGDTSAGRWYILLSSTDIE
jgi:hypothetical protein